MKETRFIDQNREKWKDLEKMLDQKGSDPDKLSDLFVQVTDDLSYARTHYGNRVVRVYLNQLTQRVFGNLYTNSLSLASQFGKFWKTDLPFAMYSARKEMLISLILFSASFLLGVISSIHDPDFAKSIMGDDYITMTQENIDANDPMAVYKQDGPLNMFFRIAINNIRIGLTSFLSGLAFAVGAVFMIIFNGIMVGVFQYFFLTKGVFTESVLTIWMHGTFEISAIIIAGGAGLVLGRGLVFPGTYTRMQSLRLSARAGIRIMSAVTMMLILAAIIESYITRLTEMNDFLRGGMIVIMAGIVAYYFAWYPFRVAKSGAFILLDEQKLPAVKPFDPELGQIRTATELFGSSFGIYLKILKKIWIKVLLLSVLLSVAINTLMIEDVKKRVVLYSDQWNFFFYLKARYIWNIGSEPVLLILITLSIAAISMWTGRTWVKDAMLNPYGLMQKEKPVRILFRWVNSVLIALPFVSLLLSGGFGIFLFLVLFPVMLFLQMSYQIGGRRAGAALSHSLGLIKRGTGSIYFLYISLLIIGILLMMFSDWAPWVLDIEMLGWLFNSEPQYYIAWKNFIIILFMISAELFIIPLFLAGSGAMFYNLEESTTGRGLKKKLVNAGLIRES